MPTIGTGPHALLGREVRELGYRRPHREFEFDLSRALSRDAGSRNDWGAAARGGIGARAEEMRGLVIQTQCMNRDAELVPRRAGDPLRFLDDLWREGGREGVTEQLADDERVTRLEGATESFEVREHSNLPRRVCNEHFATNTMDGQPWFR